MTEDKKPIDGGAYYSEMGDSWPEWAIKASEELGKWQHGEGAACFLDVLESAQYKCLLKIMDSDREAAEVLRIEARTYRRMIHLFAQATGHAEATKVVSRETSRMTADQDRRSYPFPEEAPVFALGAEI